jgi:hypothetical protein
MAVTVAAFRARFAEFTVAAYPDATVQVALDDSALQVDEDRWGRFYELGIYYLSAHELVLKTKQATSMGDLSVAGPIRHQLAGEVAYTRAVSEMTVADGDVRLAATSYGLKYLELRRLVKPVSFMVIGGSQAIAGFGTSA